MRPREQIALCNIVFKKVFSKNQLIVGQLKKKKEKKHKKINTKCIGKDTKYYWDSPSHFNCD